MDALIGHSGFVGETLLKQRSFNEKFRSTDIEQIRGRSYETLVCAGAPAQKWIANRDPDADQAKISSLITHLKSVQCQTFVLISTVDVFKSPLGVDEDTHVDGHELHAYGSNRRMLERFVEENFRNHLIVRLPGLVGNGLRKNVIFDFLNHNNLESIDSRGIFQFYPMANLWFDIEIALKAGVRKIHLTAEPVSVADISLLGFGRPFLNECSPSVACYDLKTIYGGLYNASGSDYQYSARETIQAVRCYAQAEAVLS